MKEKELRGIYSNMYKGNLLERKLKKMKFVTFRVRDEQCIGIVEEETNEVIHLQQALVELSIEARIPGTMTECIEMGEVFIELAQTVMKSYNQATLTNDSIYKLGDVKIEAPIPYPRKNIMCVGKNYVDHVLEMGSKDDMPEHIMIFTKAPTTVVGTYDKVMSHNHVTNQLDYEGELAIVIGRRGRDISVEDAFDYVFGYTIVNDITARDMQKKHKQFFLGKSLDTTCPMGPYLVEKGSVPHPQELSILTKVNGEIRQNGNTSSMIFDIPTIISVVSQGLTLEPGDIIATGTPAGVGNGFKPPKYLQSGDHIEVTVEGIGTLVNTIH
jgi:2-keto-4-pentenoate hydratase/2-oxohepta-3-ene-1,7-dioic acid hydratase in catechol pathway